MVWETNSLEEEEDKTLNVITILKNIKKKHSKRKSKFMRKQDIKHNDVKLNLHCIGVDSLNSR